MTREEFMNIKFQTLIDEAEVTINIYSADDSFTVYVCDNKWFRKYRKRIWEYLESDLASVIFIDKYGMKISMPMTCFSFKKPAAKRKQTEKQKEAAANNLRKKGVK